MLRPLDLLVGFGLLATLPPTSLADDLPPGVSNSQDPSHVPLSPAESLRRIRAPDGFDVTLFAGEPDLRRPIAFDFDDRGRLWVVENYSHPNWRADGATDRVLILEDTDHDGRFDRRRIFWSRGRYLSAIAVGHGGIWLGNSPELIFVPDRDRNDEPDGEPEVILDGFTHFSTENVLNNFHWGPDGWLYGAIGQTKESRVGRPGTPDASRVSIHRGIWRLHPVTKTFEVVARGMVNPWGADFSDVGDLFTVNTVTAHLWYIVQGMNCADHSRTTDIPYATIQSIGDHLHWGGGNWTESRHGPRSHSIAGGGHAHCGAMIYYGDNWPERYRGTLFTMNLHGRRVNNDVLRRRGSGYVAGHEKDFLFAHDEWFRGLSIKYGPDGGVFISDWHDFGECHDSDGSHRTSGRIYKVVYGRPRAYRDDAHSLPSELLAAWHDHENEWRVRHARRILHERAIRGEETGEAHVVLTKNLEESEETVLRLRSLWTLFLMDRLGAQSLARLLEDPDEHLRRWAIRLLFERGTPTDDVQRRFVRLARNDESSAVRLQLAASLQRTPLERRAALARGLVSHASDAADRFLPLMIWYGVEPLVTFDPDAALGLAAESRIPLVREFIARKATETGAAPLDRLLSLASRSPAETAQLGTLRGVLAAIEGRGRREAPSGWSHLEERLRRARDPALRSVLVRLAVVFGDEGVLSRLRELVLDAKAEDSARLEAFRSLTRLEGGLTPAHLHRLVPPPSALRLPAIRALQMTHDAETATVLLGAIGEFDDEETLAAVGVLSTRLEFARRLMDAIDGGTIGRESVSAYALQRLRRFSDAALDASLDRHWPRGSRTERKSADIARYVERMTPEYLARGSAGAGRAVFDRSCSQCHTLFGRGGTIGPDLTGSGRKSVDYVIANLVDPTATIDRAYRLTTALTRDGRLYTGFIAEQDDAHVSLRTPDGTVKLRMRDVERIETSNQSMMPEGLLETFSDEQVRDLLLYLAGDEQVAPAAR